MTPSARPGTIIETWLGPLSGAQRSAVATATFASASGAIARATAVLELVGELRQTANLMRRQADMALRHEPPESGDFYVSKAGTFACAVYRRRGADAGAWVTYTDEQAHYAPARWVHRQVEETGKPVALRAKQSASVPAEACCRAMSATAIRCSSG